MSQQLVSQAVSNVKVLLLLQKIGEKVRELCELYKEVQYSFRESFDRKAGNVFVRVGFVVWHVRDVLREVTTNFTCGRATVMFVIGGGCGDICSDLSTSKYVDHVAVVIEDVGAVRYGPSGSFDISSGTLFGLLNSDVTSDLESVLNELNRRCEKLRKLQRISMFNKEAEHILNDLVNLANLLKVD